MDLGDSATADRERLRLLESELVCGYCDCEESAHGAEPEEVDVGGLTFENDCTGCGECPGFEEEP